MRTPESSKSQGNLPAPSICAFLTPRFLNQLDSPYATHRVFVHCSACQYLPFHQKNSWIYPLGLWKKNMHQNTLSGWNFWRFCKNEILGELETSTKATLPETNIAPARKRFSKGDACLPTTNFPVLLLFSCRDDIYLGNLHMNSSNQNLCWTFTTLCFGRFWKEIIKSGHDRDFTTGEPNGSLAKKKSGEL